jgi:hypothetical protein
MSTLPFFPPVDDLQRTYEDERTRFLAGEMVCTPCLGRRLLRSSPLAVASWRAIAIEVEPPAWLGDAEASPSPGQRSVVTCA